ncbi:MAG: hypothetical protein JXR78_08750 [Victivallales bacterium]|nr:hypothetical protein [Victivallales bacterium]
MHGTKRDTGATNTAVGAARDYGISQAANALLGNNNLVNASNLDLVIDAAFGGGGNASEGLNNLAHQADMDYNSKLNLYNTLANSYRNFCR